MFTQIFSQARKLAPYFFLLYFLPLLFLFAMVVVSSQMGVSAALFTRDMARVADIHPFVGVASNLGVMLWTATATICMFTWAIIRRNPGEMRFSTFLLCSGLMTTVLAFDDLFLLHEEIFPAYLGVPEKIVLIGYAGLILCGMATFRKRILKTEYLFLLVALVFFALSLFIDRFERHIESFVGDWRILFEDGFKMLGIVGWFGYFLRCCLLRLGNKMGETL